MQRCVVDAASGRRMRLLPAEAASVYGRTSGCPCYQEVESMPVVGGRHIPGVDLDHMSGAGTAAEEPQHCSVEIGELHSC